MSLSPEAVGVMRGVATLLAMLAFVAVCVWAFSRRRREQFDEASHLPLEED
ncbi:MAG: cbb3-type cytochrome c oxidase subunit 3 [Gammaproteobacteria bacterium]|nr:cbb3-type cytochrome c oxidase subunit 3 [Gammaproteobacteria bacterium]